MGDDPETALFGRLRRRLALVIAAVIAAILGLLVGGVLLLMDQVLVGQQADALRVTALASRDELRFSGTAVRLPPDPDERGTLFFVWGPSGDLLFATDPTSAAAFSPAARAATLGSGGTSQVTASGTAGGTIFLVASEPVRSLAFAGVIQAARSLGPIRDAEGQLTILLLAGAGGGGGLAVIAAWLLAGRLLDPARAAFRRQRDFTADASHELRTPLAVVDAGLQLLARHPEQPISTQADTLSAMQTQTAGMKRLVTDLLTLARVDAGRASLDFSAVDLDVLVSSTVGAFQPLAIEHDAGLHVSRLQCGVA
ncbi:MAG: histidine kinase dimerization/phospho-acceptor domain-containing protein, partial [Candidatus Limnocylindrales bacterium]